MLVDEALIIEQVMLELLWCGPARVHAPFWVEVGPVQDPVGILPQLHFRIT